jgi:alpha-maltose-1-phosphate synthase
MKAILVCIGKFHHFDLAWELFKRNMLERIFTGYPRWKIRDEGLPVEKVVTFPWLQTPYMALIKLRMLGNGWFQNELAWWAHETLDHYVARNLPQGDILFALSGSGLNCGKAAQNSGARYICDRGSSHIRYQNSILKEEFARWEDEFPGIDPRIMSKEEYEYATADVVTVPSTFAYRSFVEMGVPHAKMRKVPYGVNLQRFERVAEPDSHQFDILFVGQVSFRKGVPDLIEAFKRVRHPKKHLYFAGAISPEMKRYLKYHPLPDGVNFLGHVPQSELKRIMSRSHVMVLPSIEEGLALVQAQALACGCPVISTWNTGAEDLFADGREGFIVPIRDPHAISEKIQLLADDPDLRSAMSELALERVMQMRGWNEYGERMALVMKEPIGGAKAN